MIKINLLPKELQEKGKGADWIILGYGVIVLFALIALSSYYFQVRGYKKNLQKKERWSQQLALIRTKVAKVEQLDAEKKVLNAKKDTVVQLFQGRLLYPKTMEALYKTLPREVWITGLLLKEDAQKNLLVEAQASALNTEVIADWLQTLESKPERFSGIVLSAIEVKSEQDSRQPAYVFKLNFVYRPPADPLQPGA